MPARAKSLWFLHSWELYHGHFSLKYLKAYFSLYNYGLGHPTLYVNLSDSSGLDHSLGSTAFDIYSRVYRSALPVLGVCYVLYVCDFVCFVALLFAP